MSTQRELTQKARNKARAYADRTFRAKHHQAYRRLMQLGRLLEPDASYSTVRIEVMTTLRHKYRYEWADLMRRANAMTREELGVRDGRRARQSPALDHDCPLCGARPGQGCHTGTGNRVSPHAGRRQLIQENDGPDLGNVHVLRERNSVGDLGVEPRVPTADVLRERNVG